MVLLLVMDNSSSHLYAIDHLNRFTTFRAPVSRLDKENRSLNLSHQLHCCQFTTVYKVIILFWITTLPVRRSPQGGFFLCFYTLLSDKLACPLNNNRARNPVIENDKLRMDNSNPVLLYPCPSSISGHQKNPFYLNQFRALGNIKGWHAIPRLEYK